MMSAHELAAVEGKVPNGNFFDFNPRFFDLDSFLDPERGLLKGTFTPSGEFLLPLPEGVPNLTFKGGSDDGAELRLPGLLGLLNLSLKGFRKEVCQLFGLLDPRREPSQNFKGTFNDGLELNLSGVACGTAGGMNLLNLKGTSNAELPLIGLLGPRGLNLNLLGLSLLGKK